VFERATARSQLRSLSGVYTRKSASSESRKARPLAHASCGETSVESAAPTTMATIVQVRPSSSCTRSRSVNARPAQSTPDGAQMPGATGSRHGPSGTHQPRYWRLRFARKMVAM
jgi:hypothetical protein